MGQLVLCLNRKLSNIKGSTDKLQFGSINWVDNVNWHRKNIRELTLRVLALRRSKWIPSDEGLTLETSAPESHYGGQFTLSTQLIEPNCSLSVDPLILLNLRLRQLILISLDVGVADAAFRAISHQLLGI